MTFVEQLLTNISDDTKYIFAVPGRTVFPFLKHAKACNITDIVCACETGAGFMADGYARASKNYGVALTVSGPGFANVFPALVNAYYDNSKVLFLVGGTESFLGGRNSFQDNSSNQLSSHQLAMPLTAYSCTLTTQDAEYQYNNSMFYLKNHSRPVVMNVPIDIQNLNTAPLKQSKQLNRNFINTEALNRIKKIICNHDFIFVTGSRAIEAKPELSQLCEQYHILTAATLCSKAIISETLPNYLGIFGFGMSPAVFELITEQAPEFIITIGMDINERNTYKWTNLPLSHVIHIDSEMSENSRDHYFINEGYITSLADFFNAINNDPQIRQALKASVLGRKEMIRSLSTTFPMIIQHQDNSLLYVDQVINRISNHFQDKTNFVTDSGLHRLYCAQLLQLKDSCGYFSSINNAHMGWAIPASIGVKLANINNECVCITGDGCMLMNGMEIQTAAKYKIKVLFVVINNSSYGAIENANINYPQLLLNKHQYEIKGHDWKLFANSLGINAIQINNILELQNAIDLFTNESSPLLLDVRCAYDSNININAYYESMVAGVSQVNSEIELVS